MQAATDALECFDCQQPIAQDEKHDCVLARVAAHVREREEHRTRLRAEAERLTAQLAMVRRALAQLGDPPPTWSRSPTSQTAAILRFVEEHPGCTSSEIHEATGNNTMCTALATRMRPRLRREKVGGLWRYYPMTQTTVADKETRHG